MSDCCDTFFECLPERSVLAGPPPTSVFGHAVTTDLIAVYADLSTELLVSKYNSPPICLGTRCDKVLIQGHVSAALFAAQTLPLQRPIPEENWQGSSLPIKLRVRRCKWPGWVYIDADASVLMDGGEDLQVQIVAPQSWVALPSDVAGTELPADYMAVDVKIRACVLSCCPPRRSSLTWYAMALDAGATMTRPRRATELWIATGQGGAPVVSTWHFADRQNAFIGGNFSINPAFVNGIIFPGAAERIVLDSPGVDPIMVWRIE